MMTLGPKTGRLWDSAQGVLGQASWAPGAGDVDSGVTAALLCSTVPPPGGVGEGSMI